MIDSARLSFNLTRAGNKCHVTNKSVRTQCCQRIAQSKIGT